MLTAFYTDETDKVELIKTFSDLHHTHVIVYLVVNFSFTPFANNWKLMFTINSIVWYCSVVVSGIIDPGGLVILVGKTGMIIDLFSKNIAVVIVALA